jgi:hypothetical protein
LRKGVGSQDVCVHGSLYYADSRPLWADVAVVYAFDNCRMMKASMAKSLLVFGIVPDRWLAVGVKEADSLVDGKVCGRANDPKIKATLPSWHPQVSNEA